MTDPRTRSLTETMDDMPLLPHLREDPDLAPVADLLTQVRGGVLHPPAAATRDAHLAAIAAALPASPQPAPVLRHRLRHRLRLTFAAAGMKIALASTAAVAATGGMAATDTLPPPVQDRIANIVAPIGLDLPGGDDTTSAGGPAADGPAVPAIQDAPGRQADDDTPAREHAPGHRKRADADGARSARDHAPGFREPEPSTREQRRDVATDRAGTPQTPADPAGSGHRGAADDRGAADERGAADDRGAPDAPGRGPDAGVPDTVEASGVPTGPDTSAVAPKGSPND